MKKKIYAIVALLAISVLPGCGKSKNDGVINGQVNYGGFTGGVNGQGGCYNLQYSNGPITMGFSGQGYAAYGGVEALMQGATSGLPGVTHVRTNHAGDTLQMYVNGNSSYGVATLQPGTINLLMQYGVYQICGLYVNSSVSGSSLDISAQFIAQGGRYVPRTAVSL